MGCDSYVYVGAYCKLEMQEEKVVSSSIYNGCNNNKCKLHKSQTDQKLNKFCPSCGNPIREVAFAKSFNQIREFDLFDLESKDLSVDDFIVFNRDIRNIILMPNGRDHSGQVFYSESYSFADPVITSDTVTSSVAEFIEKYSKQLAIIEKEYNTKIEIKFGVVSYYD